MNNRLRTVVLLPGEALAFSPADWADHLVVVERGELEVECHAGTRARFGPGSVLAFTQFTPRALRNPAPAPGGTRVVLRALSRGCRGDVAGTDAEAPEHPPTDEGPPSGASHG